MRQTNCNTRVDCAFLAIAAAIIVGIVSAIAQFTAIVTFTTVFYIVAFGVAVLFLTVLLALVPVLYKVTCQSCCGSNVKLATIGILGAIAASIVLLAVGFAATSSIGAVFVGLLAAFFTLTVTSIVCTINCASECRYGKDSFND